MPTIPVSNIFTFITNKEAIKYFNDEGIYKINFRQDFVSVISKKDVIQYLIENNDYVTEEFNNIGDFVIMDNDKLVGKNYLTFIYNIEYGEVRYKQ